MGRPVVALRGATLIARQSASLLGAMELPELVAHDEASFVDVAEAIAKDEGRRAELAATLRARLMDSPVGHCEAFTRDLEGLYRGAWRRWSEAWR
jgi:predicted O-linked N-acetylglucosamine transferase (SPINDLY family)